jgi:hypothetical protein
VTATNTAASTQRPVRHVHPVIDELGDGFAVFATSTVTVRFTEPFALFVTESVDFGLRPVLMTRMDARVTPFVAAAMRRAGGFWAVQARDRATYDALTGRRLENLPDLWGAPVVEPHGPWSAVGPVAARPVVAFEVRAQHRATDTTTVGRLAQDTVAALGGSPLDRWDTREPLLEPWDLSRITDLARAGMAHSQIVRARGEGGAFCEITVDRTRTGLLERVVGGVVAPPGASRADLVSLGGGALERLAQQHTLTQGSTSLVEYDDGGPAGEVVQHARSRSLETPLAQLYGPRAVTTLGSGLDELRRRFDARSLGPARAPSVLVRISPSGAARTEQEGGA